MLDLESHALKQNVPKNVYLKVFLTTREWKMVSINKSTTVVANYFDITDSVAQVTDHITTTGRRRVAHGCRSPTKLPTYLSRKSSLSLPPIPDERDC